MQEKFIQEGNYVKTTVAQDLSWVGEFEYQQEDISLLEEKEATPLAMGSYRKHIMNNAKGHLVVSYNTKRARHDAQTRRSQKVEKQLDQTNNTAKLVSNAVLKKDTSSKGKSYTSIDIAKIEEHALWNGFYGVITNISKETVDPSHILTQ